MAENEGAENRTEDPTPRRRQKAREEGRIAKSPELAAAVLLLTGTTLLASTGGSRIGDELVRLFRTGPGWLTTADPSAASAVTLIRLVVGRAFVAMLPFAVGLALVAIAIGLVQTRGNVSSKPARPDLSRINPLSGLKRIFGADAAFNLLKSSLKLAILGTVTYLVLRRAWPHFIELGDARTSDIAAALSGATTRLALTVGIAFLALGALDFGVQFFKLEKSLKMSRQEVVQEHREQEGDPHIKARIRQIARQRARQRMLTAVAKADVVVTNPTHIAIALKYDAAVSPAPIVVAMGERKLAERIKLLAKQANVPLVENKPLARALLATCTVGAPIPPAMYVAVAEILAFVYRMRGRIPGALRNRAAQPKPEPSRT
jgi:flagellar biosynthetic protein FlhB